MRAITRSLLAVTVATGLALTLVGAPAQANQVSTIATGLDNPRGLSFAPNGALYVTESGRGGDGPCFSGPDGDEVCWGATGAITRVWDGKQKRVLEGLPSIAARDGSAALGPSDVSFRGTGGMYFTVGLGADPAVREELPELGQDANGWLLRGQKRSPGWRQVADIAGFEAAENPDGGEPDSNPNSVFATRSGQAVVDAGGNTLLWVSPNGRISTIAVFPERMVEAPPFLGLPPGTKIPMQSVPTSVVRGPDGAWYVGELTGFPFPKGAARVFRVVPGKAPQVYAKGFTNIIDIGFRKGTLYVLEIAHNGLLSEDPTGALIRVDRKGSYDKVFTKGLRFPGGLALRKGAAFVSNCSVCPGDGTVLRIRL